MQYIREDLGSEISKEVAEFQAEVTKLTASFDKAKLADFEARIKKLRVKKNDITKRLGAMEKTLGGNIPVRRSMHADVKQRLSGRIANIAKINNAVTM